MNGSESLKNENGSDVGKIGGRMLQTGKLQHGTAHIAEGALCEGTGKTRRRPPERRLGLQEAPSWKIDGTGTGTGTTVGKGRRAATAAVRAAAAGATARSRAAAGEGKFELRQVAVDKELWKWKRARPRG